MSRLQRLIRVARGQEPADLVLTGGKIVNVFSGRIEEGDLALAGDSIAGIGHYEGHETVSVSGRFLAPGYRPGFSLPRLAFGRVDDHCWCR